MEPATILALIIVVLVGVMARNRGYTGWNDGFLQTALWCIAGQTIGFLIATAFRTHSEIPTIVGPLVGGLIAYWRVRKKKPKR